jgi:hypothetical protein
MTDLVHDPLCAMARDTDASDYGWCMCPLISKVREDTLARCIAAMEAIPPTAQHVDEIGMISLVYDKGEILTALQALQEKP